MSDWRRQTVSNHRPPGRPLPHGVIDRFWQEAAALREAESVLREVYRRWGYTEYIPPTFEYAETLSTGTGAPLQEQMYRFFDRDGKVLALRPDMTIPTARLVGSKLFDQPFPQRYFYTGPVFRYQEPVAGMPREFYQAGVELLGAADPEADAEVLALAVASLQTLGLARFRLVLGQMAFFRGLLESLQLDPADAAVLHSALDRKSAPELQELVSRWGLRGRLREALLTLPQLHGTQGVLAAATKVALNDTMRSALENLRAVERVAALYGIKEMITLDLAEVRGMEYYTGITFEGFVPGLGVAVLSGGRYDHLVGAFGRPQPAVGFAITLDRVLRAWEAQGTQPVVWSPQVVVGGELTRKTLTEVRRLREAGVRVVCYYEAEQAEVVRSYAMAWHIPGVVWCDREAVLAWWEGHARALPSEAWADEVMGWVCGTSR